MQIEAIYDQGEVKIITPIKLKRDHVKFVLEIPDELLDTIIENIDPMLNEIYNMLGNDYKYVPSGLTDNDILLDALEEKYSR
ncbi:MAG: hypothetical protein HQK73_02980 [Desulfamplus sp.]|nr:hypothetical protein [Desulfamplus sp.]MBF0411674.1 hypothetical protein [Desulfamplus sp.]